MKAYYYYFYFSKSQWLEMIIWPVYINSRPPMIIMILMAIQRMEIYFYNTWPPVSYWCGQPTISSIYFFLFFRFVQSGNNFYLLLVSYCFPYTAYVLESRTLYQQNIIISLEIFFSHSTSQISCYNFIILSIHLFINSKQSSSISIGVFFFCFWILPFLSDIWNYIFFCYSKH